MRNRIILIVCINLFVTAAVLSGYHLLVTPTRTAYVKSNLLFDEFKLKKQLELELKNVQDKRQAVLDSLALELRLLSTSIRNSGAGKEKIETFKIKQETYMIKDKSFKEDNAALTRKYDDQIWTQINQYVKEYGEKNGYRYIFGANGDGSLMFAGDGEDITDKVIQFINNRYEGI